MPDHPGLAQRERHEDPDDVELDELGDLGVVDDDQEDRGPGEDEDAVGEGEPVAAGVQLARQEAVLGEDRAEHREAVEGGVGGEDEDEAGDERRRRRPEREAGEDRLAQLADDGVLHVARRPTGCPLSSSCVAGSSAILTPVSRPSRMIDTSMVIEMLPMSSRVVAALRLLGFWKAGTPLVIASTPVSAAQPDENARSSRNAAARPARPWPSSGTRVYCGARGRSERPGEVRKKPTSAHADDAEHERVDRHGEGLAGLADPAQVHRGEQHDEHRRRSASRARASRAGRSGVLHARGDRHRDGEDVVDEQRAGHGEAGPGAEVDAWPPRSPRRRRGRRARSAGRTRRRRA